MAPTTIRPPSSNRLPPANNLLAALPAEDYARLAPALRNTPLRLKRVLHKPGEAIDHVYSPGGSFVLVVTVRKDGGMVEVATIGREGVAGVSAILNGHPHPSPAAIPLTQEFAAMMLGTSRPTVTVVAGTLQKAGLIKYRRGHVIVVDRKNLEAASCECYQTATDLMNPVTRRRS